MSENKRFRRTFPAVALLPLAMSTAVADDHVSAECRGVAAAVVASMRAAGEVSSQEAIDAAVVAARRACGAALEGLSAGAAGESAGRSEGSAESTAGKEKDDISLWDLLTEDRERKPGNERLRRLKQ